MERATLGGGETLGDVLQRVGDTVDRYGLVKLINHPDNQELLRLEFATAYTLTVTGLRDAYGTEIAPLSSIEPAGVKW